MAWQKARLLVRDINIALRDGPATMDFRFRDQICSAALSVMSNIAEGFERGTKREFHQFLVIAGSSCGEVRSQLYAALDLGYVTDEQFRELYDLCDHTGRLCTAFRKSLGVDRKQ